MKPCLLIGLIWIVLLSACATHYYRIESRQVVLILRKPQAETVLLFSSLDGFKPRKAEEVSGRWRVMLPAGRAFKYFYRVDGAPFLPDCPMKEKDDFGSENCIFDPAL